jgi:hypothetical protein
MLANPFRATHRASFEHILQLNAVVVGHADVPHQSLLYQLLELQISVSWMDTLIPLQKA